MMDDLLSVANHITSLRPSKAKNIIDETIGIVSRWRDYAEEEGVPEALIVSVEKSLRLNW